MNAIERDKIAKHLDMYINGVRYGRYRVTANGEGLFFIYDMEGADSNAIASSHDQYRIADIIDGLMRGDKRRANEK